MKRSLAAQQTRSRLLRAAREQTEAGGYGAASVTAIAERAGLGAGTLYSHFPSKAELFVELFRDVCGGELAAMRDAAAGDADSSVARLERALGTFAHRALQNPRLAWALMAEPLDPLVDAERLVFRADYARLLAVILRDAITAGELPEQNVELSAAAIVGGAGEALVGPLSPLAADPPAIDATVHDITTFCAAGRRSPPMSAVDAVSSHRVGPITTVTLHRPDVANAVDGPTAAALADAFRAFAADPEAARGDPPRWRLHVLCGGRPQGSGHRPRQPGRPRR